MASSTTFRASAIRSRAAGARMALSRPSATAARDSIVSEAPSSTTISAPLLGQCFSRDISGAEPGPPLILTHRSSLARTWLQVRAPGGPGAGPVRAAAGHHVLHRALHIGQVRRGCGRGGFVSELEGRVSSSIMERLGAGAVLGAEGYVFELERRGYIKAGPFVPEVVLDYPDAVRELHREFLRAGADVMVALTYYAHREKLRDGGRDGDAGADPARPDPRRLPVRGGVPDPRRRGGAGRRPELRPWPADDAAADHRHPGGRGLRRRRPAGAVPDRRDRPHDGDPTVTGRGAGLPHRARPLRLHALRDGALRTAGPRTRRGLRGYLLRGRPASRPGHGRGAGPRGPGQQVLAVDGSAPDVPGRCRGQGRGLPAHLDRVTARGGQGPTSAATTPTSPRLHGASEESGEPVSWACSGRGLDGGPEQPRPVGPAISISDPGLAPDEQLVR